MKIKPSYYVLVAEILTITLFHVVKFRQAERHPAEIVYTKAFKAIPIHQTLPENKTGINYAIEYLVK